MNIDWWKEYDWLVGLWYEKHYSVHHGKNEFARWNLNCTAKNSSEALIVD